MFEMNDEAMALTVAEATMQDFLAAVMLVERSPAPIPTVRVQPSRPLIDYPVTRHPVRSRLQPAATRLATLPRPVAHADKTASVAGARTVYWLALAAAMAAVALL
jgi:hypothetical protein